MISEMRFLYYIKNGVIIHSGSACCQRPAQKISFQLCFYHQIQLYHLLAIFAHTAVPPLRQSILLGMCHYAVNPSDLATITPQRNPPINLCVESEYGSGRF